MTYSIIARDAEAGEIGVAVASFFFAAGAIVPHVHGPRAAVATQSYPNPIFGTEGAARLNAGEMPEDVLRDLVSRDAARDDRQCHMMDIDGRMAQFTGDACTPWAGHLAGPDVSAAGNILAGPEVVGGMVSAFLDSADKPLAERLLDAMDAAEAAGGDKRGRQSAGLAISRGEDWRFLDLRVDDHAEPLAELRRLYEVSGEVYQHVAVGLPTRDDYSRYIDVSPGIIDDAERRERLGIASQSKAWRRP